MKSKAMSSIKKKQTPQINNNEERKDYNGATHKWLLPSNRLNSCNNTLTL
jgi:hypothetical protein